MREEGEILEDVTPKKEFSKNNAGIETTITEVKDENEHTNANIDQGFAWILLAAVFTVDFLCRPIQKILGILLNSLKTELNVSNTVITLIPGIMSTLTGFLAPLSTYMGNRFGCRPMVIFGGILVACGLCFVYVMTNPVAVILTLSILPGIGLSFISYPNVMILTQYFKNRLTTANGLRLTGNSAGSIVFTLILPILIEEFNVYGGILIIGGLILNIPVLGIFYRPVTSQVKHSSPSTPSSFKVDALETAIPSTNNNDLFIKERRKQENEQMQLYTYYGFDQYVLNKPDVHQQSRISHTQSKADLIQSEQKIFYICGLWPCDCTNSRIDFFLLNSLKYWASVVSVTFMYLQYTCVLIILPSHSQSLNISIQNSALLITLISIAELITKLLAGFIIDATKVNRRSCMLVGLILSTAITFIVPFVNYYWFLLLYSGLYGIIFGVMSTVMVPLLAELHGSNKMPSVLGFSGPFTAVFFLGLPLIIGILADTYDSFKETFFLVASLSVLPALCEIYIIYIIKVKR